jgi:hypothetical protein
MNEVQDEFVIQRAGKDSEYCKIFENKILVWEGKYQELEPILEKTLAEHKAILYFMEKHTGGDSNVDIALEAVISLKLGAFTLVTIFNALVELLNLAPLSITIEMKRGFIGAFLVIFAENISKPQNQNISIGEIFPTN